MRDNEHSKTPNSTEEKKETLSLKKTPTKKARRKTKTGNSASQGRTTKTSKTLEQEAKEFKAKRNPPPKPKPMTSRVYLIGQAMGGILARSQGMVSLEDLKRESEQIADFMLKD